MSDADDESSQVKVVPSVRWSSFLTPICFFYRRDAYKKWKHELDVLYTLGEPRPEKVTKL